MRLRFKMTSAERCTLMDKAYPSRKQKHCARSLASFPACILFIAISPQVFSAITFSHAEALRIGKRIWQNECNGTVSGLTSWNTGENFASLGIGHFIWYPVGKRGPFEESFPPLLVFLRSSGASIPNWLSEAHGCPWATRAEFLAATKSEKMVELRALLAKTIGLQARFAANRLEQALPKMLATAPAEKRALVQCNFARVAALPNGT